jgi:hypothetical protein
LIISDSGGHIIDYDHSKVGFITGEAAVALMNTEDAIEIATNILKSKRKAEIYVDQLQWLWGIRDRPATREDFGWPEVGYRSSHWPYKPLD